MDRRSDLAAQLERYQPADARERRHLERMRGLLDAPGDPFARDRYAPGHFTASAFVLSPDAERVLLVLHGKLGRWLQPGGHVDPADASVLDTALRELGEETGLDGAELVVSDPLDLDVHRIPPFGDAPEHEHFDVRFLLRARSEACRAGSDAKSARWFELDAVSASESDQSVLRALGKARGLSA